MKFTPTRRLEFLAGELKHFSIINACAKNPCGTLMRKCFLSNSHFMLKRSTSTFHVLIYVVHQQQLLWASNLQGMIDCIWYDYCIFHPPVESSVGSWIEHIPRLYRWTVWCLSLNPSENCWSKMKGGFVGNLIRIHRCCILLYDDLSGSAKIRFPDC